MEFIDPFINQGRAFVNAEAQAELNEYNAVYNEHTFDQLEKLGFAISNFKITSSKRVYIDKKILTFTKTTNERFNPRLRIKVGDSVAIAEKQDVLILRFNGVVHSISSTEIQIQFDYQKGIYISTKFSPFELIIKSPDNVTFDRSVH